MRWLQTGCVLVAIALVSVDSAGAQQARQWDAEKVEKAIEKAKAYLWSQWSKDENRWKSSGRAARGEGTTALCAYALLTAGESPQKPRMKKTLMRLAKVKTNSTYARAVRANAWAVLGPHSRHSKRLTKDIEWLIKAMDAKGRYDYSGAVRDNTKPDKGELISWDNSNSQLAVLGVWAGMCNGVKVPTEYWQLVERHWKKCQNPDGGWSYQHVRGNRSYGSMTAAGLATMFICFDVINYKQFVDCDVDSDYAPVTRGLEWMDKHFTADTNPGKPKNWHYYYYLYGVERVGLASGYKYFGKKDWYKLGASSLFRRQLSGGQWGKGLIDTSFALLFLARGQHPILFNKLKYPGSWNCRPRDLANLTRWISRDYEKPVNWQIIPLDVPVSEWHDAPILYISGATAPTFSDKDIESLRRFVYQGGVIFSESAGNRKEFDEAMKACYAKIFPRYKLKRLGEEHPLFNLLFKIRRHEIFAVSNGVRLLAIHSPKEVSRALQLNEYKDQVDIFRLMANIYFFVTDKGSLRKRGVSPWPVAEKFTPVDTLKVAVVRHRGNFNPEPLAWKRFSILMGNRHKIAVDVSKPTAMTDLDVSRRPVAVMTGTKAFTLTDAERDAVGKYIKSGGTLVVDAAGGSEAFALAAEAEFCKVFTPPPGRFELIPSKHAVYTGVGTPVGKVSYRRSLRALVGDPNKPRLKGLSYKGRPAIIFSRYDLTAGLVGYPCWGLNGYSPESAFTLMRNILLYASGKKLAGK